MELIKKTSKKEEDVREFAEFPMDIDKEKVKKMDKDKLMKSIGVKRKSLDKLISDMETTLDDLEELSILLDKDENVEELLKKVEKNKDIAELFCRKEGELIGKKISFKDYVKAHGYKKGKKVKDLIKSLTKNRFAYLVMLIDRADPFEAKAILEELLPQLIQAGVSEQGVKDIVEALLPALEKGRIRGSKEFFTKLRKIISFISYFGGGERTIGLLKRVV